MTPAEGRKFGVTVGAAFVALGALLAWRERETAAVILAGLGAALLLAGIAVPAHLGGVYRAWMRFALLLSKVTTPIFMGVVYYVVITPVGLMRRAIGRNPLVAEGTPANSNWVPLDTTRRGDLRRLF